MSAPYTVWLASYPKSGNTWVRAVLSSLDGGTGIDRSTGIDINNLQGGPIASERHHVEQHLGFATSLLHHGEIDLLRPACCTALDRLLDTVRFRKIHDALYMTDRRTPIVDPASTRCAVYIVRDPRDVAVSFASHTVQTLEQTVASMCDPEHNLASKPGRLHRQLRQRLGTWSEHVISWLDHDLFPVHLVRYEDLHADPVGQFGAIAEFAGLAVRREQVEAAVEAARFDRLRAQESKSGFRERPNRCSTFFRRGVVGSWRDELPLALVRHIETDSAPTMDRLGYAIAADGYPTADESSVASPSTIDFPST